MVPCISLVSIPKHVVGITRHVVTTIFAFSFTMLLLDRILTHIVNHMSNTSYHLQYLYCQVGYVFGAKPNLITCVGYFFWVHGIRIIKEEHAVLMSLELCPAPLLSSLRARRKNKREGREVAFMSVRADWEAQTRTLYYPCSMLKGEVWA